VRDPETFVIGAPRGKVTRFVQIGTLGIFLCAGTALLLLAMAVSLHLTVLVLGIVAILLCGVLLSTLTIEVDDGGIFWCFTGGLFSRRVEFENVASFEPARWQRLSLGYRVWFNKRAWIVSGRNVVALQMADSAMQYIVGCDDPEAVCAEIERRRAERASG
jgi:hypothetical protein